MVETPRSAPGIDLSLLPPHLTWARFGLAFLLCAVLFVAAAHPVTGHHLHLASPVPLAMIAGYPLAYLALMLGERLWLDPALRWLRTLVVVYAPATVAALGACSHLSVSPAYGVLLWLPPCWGHLFAGNRAMAVSMALSPLALRLATVPDATAASLAVAATIGVAVAGAFLAFSWRRVVLRARRRRELLGEALGAATVERAADRWTAMRLHDRLSGVLMLAAARGDDGDLARLVVARARATLGDPRRSEPMTGAACAAALAALAGSLGLDVDLRARGSRRASVVWHELHDLLVELIANHARHRGAGALRIRMAMRAGMIRARVAASAASSPLSAPAGRGRRNLALRTEALGGQLRWSDGDGWSVAIALPAIDVAAGLGPVLVGVEVLAHGVALAAVARASVVFALVFGATTILLAGLQALDLRRDRALHDARRAELRAAIDAAAAQAVARTRATLVPLVDRLDGADDAAARRAAITGLAATLGDLLAALEGSTAGPAARA